jgi:hypothetical protein
VKSYRLRYRAGQPLGSIVNPQNEAKRWVQSNEKLMNWAEIFCVLGFGNGFHIAALKEKYPSKKVYVIELDQEIACTVKEEVICEYKNANDFLNLINPKAERLIVLSFKPAWILFEKEYEKIKIDLLGSNKIRNENYFRIKNPCPIDPLALIASELIK